MGTIAARRYGMWTCSNANGHNSVSNLLGSGNRAIESNNSNNLRVSHLLAHDLGVGATAVYVTGCPTVASVRSSTLDLGGESNGVYVSDRCGLELTDSIIVMPRVGGHGGQMPKVPRTERKSYPVLE